MRECINLCYEHVPACYSAEQEEQSVHVDLGIPPAR